VRRIRLAVVSDIRAEAAVVTALAGVLGHRPNLQHLVRAYHPKPVAVGRVAVGGTKSVAVAVGRGGPGGSARMTGKKPVVAKVSASTERIQPSKPNPPIAMTIPRPVHERFDMMNSVSPLVS
jgi:hypothetical protein